MRSVDRDPEAFEMSVPLGRETNSPVTGFYEAILTESIAGALNKLDPAKVETTELLDVANSAEQLAGEISRQLTSVLDDVEGDGAEKVRRQIDLLNHLLADLRRRQPSSGEAIDAIDVSGRVLRSIMPLGEAALTPETGLARPWLFTASKGTPSLLEELRKEASDCDQLDVLVSFITVSGVRKLLDVLTTASGRKGSARSATKIRVITTTYIGATEIEALDMLARLGAEVRVSLDGRRTRLHAKAWIFRRETGFGTAYVGSANLSAAAMLGGLEWTVKFTQRAQADLFEKANAHFETLWCDAEFERYDPENHEHRSALKAALRREAGNDLLPSFTFFELEPKSYQSAMLEALVVERAHGRTRNLLVAATGTGKTVVAAFDYRNRCRESGTRPRLLFVAHREEILQQSMATYRVVLRDQEFGDVLAGGREPHSPDHLFATIQSVRARGLLATHGPSHWQVVVVDECHHLGADSFREFMGAIKPEILLGLTATPERGDGIPILPFFQNRLDGSPAVELRLWHALDLQLLSPFDYFACDDPTDFGAVPWDQPGETASLDRLVTGNNIRAQSVIDEWVRLSGDPRRGRALAFCVTVAHAEFMADCFNAAGIPAMCVVGSTDARVRREAPGRLARGELSVLTTCDLYNEGIDIPSVDTLLLLRPTQSPVLFQQQIGRGLRLSPDTNKAACLVLDFVGRHKVEFRFDRLFSRLLGLTRTELIDAVEKGFSRLPAGCHVHLAKFAREQVLRNLRAATQQTWRRLTAELRGYVAVRGRANVQLADFIREQGVDVEDIFRGHGRSGWATLQRDAGLRHDDAGPEEDYFGRRFGALLHLDDAEYLEAIQSVAETKSDYGVLSTLDRDRLQMLAYQVDGQSSQIGDGDSFLKRLNGNSASRAELGELASVLVARTSSIAAPVPGLEDTPLRLHSRYGIREILTAVKWLTPTSRGAFKEGVLALKNRATELLFVTLDKSEALHAAIAYHDYAISPDRFHWQSQNAAGPETGSGRRYLESPGNGWKFQLFVRARKGDPYSVIGPVELIEAHGAKPMSITWKLSVPMPARLFAQFSVLRAV